MIKYPLPPMPKEKKNPQKNPLDMSEKTDETLNMPEKKLQSDSVISIPVRVNKNQTEISAPTNATRSTAPANTKSNKGHKKLRTFGKLVLFFGIIIIITGVAFTYQITFSADGFFRNHNSAFSQVKNLFLPGNDKLLQGENGDRIDILMIGYGGPGHEGSFLADTIILASIKPSTKQVTLLSIPRDLYVPIPGNAWRKINSAFALGRNEKDKEGGEKLLLKTVSDITGINISYYVQIDFTGFTKSIDKMGGVDIDIACGFIDYQYPTTNYGYQTIAFKPGTTHMKGDLALKFARSRHGTTTTKGCPSEGSDFARSRRQQQILSATKAKALSLGTLLRPDKILGMMNDLGTHAGTNMQLWEFARVVDLTKDLTDDKISNITLDTTNLLYSATTEDGASILRPKAGLDDFSAIKSLAANIFSKNPIETDPTITLINGNNKSASLTTAMQLLTSKGLTATTSSIPAITGYEKTVIYDQSNGQKPQNLQALKKLLKANVASVLPTPLITNSNTPTPKYDTDFVIVVGAQ